MIIRRLIKPFIPIDEQLKRFGWNKFYENEHGFRYIKKLGVDIFYYADFNGHGIRFHDEVPELYSIEVSEATLNLFAAKIKEWRRQNECSNKGGRHYSKEQS